MNNIEVLCDLSSVFYQVLVQGMFALVLFSFLLAVISYCLFGHTAPLIRETKTFV